MQHFALAVLVCLLFASPAYIVNRPEFEISTPSGVIETKFKGDGFVMNTGVVFVF